MHEAPKSESDEPGTTPENQESGVSSLVIAELRAEVKDLRKQLDGLRAHLRDLTLRKRFRRWSAKLFRVRLHQFDHYPAQELIVPERYLRPYPLSNPPLISIVTPSYNQGQFLEQTIRSVLDQKYPKLEYAVQDGGSKDETVDVLNRYHDRLLHVESRKDKGQGNAINLGFTHASHGEIMAYLNSDDLLMPGSLNYVAAYFAAHPDVDVVYGHRVIIDSNGKEIGRWVLPNHSDLMLTWADYVPQETMFWRRSIWDKAGGKIDESYQFALDWDLLLRFRGAGAKFVRLPRFLGAFRVHESQKTSANLATTGNMEMARLRLRVHGWETTMSEIRRNMNGYILRHAWHNFLYELGLSRP
jgi:glycosyltransferase involved in cell wall biosynthesis